MCYLAVAKRFFFKSVWSRKFDIFSVTMTQTLLLQIFDLPLSDSNEILRGQSSRIETLANKFSEWKNVWVTSYRLRKYGIFSSYFMYSGSFKDLIYDDNDIICLNMQLLCNKDIKINILIKISWILNCSFQRNLTSSIFRTFAIFGILVLQYLWYAYNS